MNLNQLSMVGAICLSSCIGQGVAADLIDYYAPPVDAVPKMPIADYTRNTRVPDYHWLKYDDAYSLALRIRPIDGRMIEREIAVGLVDTNRNKSALSFSLAAEDDSRFRTVVIDNLDLDASEFTGMAFKVRATARNAGSGFIASLSGRGVSARSDELCAKPSGGFNAMFLPLKARPGARINSISFEVDRAESEDFDQEYEIIDLRLLRAKPKARLEELPPRRWMKKGASHGEWIDDVFAYVRGEGASESMPALPKTYELRPQLEKERDGGFEVEHVVEKVLGKEAPAVRITLRHGPRCLLRFPLAFDGLHYNTFTFLAKVETFAAAEPVLGDQKPMLWGTNQTELNRPFDTFQISFFSKTHDFCDWARWGLAQADYCQNKEMSSVASRNPDGWRAFAYDIANSDPSNNKSAFYTKLTHWCFYYDNRKIPEGQKVVVTIADPRLTRGLMLSGGDMEKYAAFLKKRDTKRIVDFKAMDQALNPPERGRLARPIQFVENRLPKGRLYVLGADFPRSTSKEGRRAYSRIVLDAAQEFCDVLQRKFAMAADIPVETCLPSAKERQPVNSIIVGGNAYAKVDKAQFLADMKVLAGNPGCAIRSDGTNIYIYAAQYNYAGNARALAFGLYELLENNTDLIYPHVAKSGRPARVFAPSASRDFDLVWGDGFVHAPKMPEYSMFGVDGPNRVPGFDWQGNWRFARRRTRSVNHWWGYGTAPVGDEKRGEPNDTWGRRADGTLMKPGCYTGHPCLIRVLERAKSDYLHASAFAPRAGGAFAETQPHGRAFAWNCYDVHGLWVEDSISMCQCAECLTPIRLADGSTVGPESPYFRSTQFYSNGSAMINAVNVFAHRDARVESIAYFWMAPVPLMTVSRSYDVRFCPYVRKNYFLPIYAPMNDMHWRAMKAWSQQDVHLSIYEYFLFVGLRPWADIAAFDVAAEADLGLIDWHAEAEVRGFFSVLSRMEKWVMERLLWGSMGDDVPVLRGYYLKRTFREAAEPIGRFYSLAMSCALENLAFASPMEFDDGEVVIRNAMRTKADGFFASGSVADEMEKCVAEAERRVRDPMAAEEVRALRAAWDKAFSEASEKESEWLKDVSEGSDSQEAKVLGAPE